MLRYIGLMILFLGLVPGIASADEYGEHFYNQTPMGMAEYTAPEYETPDIAMDKAADGVNDIMPAAGDKTADEATETVTDEEEASSAQDQAAE